MANDYAKNIRTPFLSATNAIKLTPTINKYLQTEKMGWKSQKTQQCAGILHTAIVLLITTNT